MEQNLIYQYVGLVAVNTLYHVLKILVPGILLANHSDAVQDANDEQIQ